MSEAAVEEIENDGGRRPTVMVVDDNDELRELLGLWLERHGCRAVEASNGTDAVGVAMRERPDLILMDLHMPEVDGFGAAYRIRLIAKLGSHVPIIAMSADGSLGNEAREPTTEAHHVGFSDFTQKPFSPGQLEDILERYLPKAKMGAAVLLHE